MTTHNDGRVGGKVTIITGAAKGIGRATATRFAEEGARLAICDYDQAALDTAAEELAATGTEVLSLYCDIRDEAQIEDFFAKVLDHYGRIDVLVANAGIIPEATVASSDLATWDNTFAVDGRGMFWCGKLATDQMVKQGSGSIVFLSSISAYGGQTGQAIYGPAKFVAAGLCKHFSVHVADKGIRVNAVSPGTIDTPAVAEMDDEGIEAVVAMHPMKRMGRPEEVANGILFLASDEASFITGTDLRVDGGYLAQ